MAYDRKKEHKKVLERIKDKDLIFIQDILDLSPFSKETFYRWWPKGSNEHANVRAPDPEGSEDSDEDFFAGEKGDPNTVEVICPMCGNTFRIDR